MCALNIKGKLASYFLCAVRSENKYWKLNTESKLRILDWAKR